MKDGATVGIGAGQMSRVDSARIAFSKAKDAAKAAGLDTPLTVEISQLAIDFVARDAHVCAKTQVLFRVAEGHAIYPNWREQFRNASASQRECNAAGDCAANEYCLDCALCKSPVDVCDLCAAYSNGSAGICYTKEYCVLDARSLDGCGNQNMSCDCIDATYPFSEHIYVKNPGCAPVSGYEVK